jgi:hypothetical protein
VAERDPWLPAKMRGRVHLAQAERRFTSAARDAAAAYLTAVRAAVLHHDTRHTAELRADASPADLPPNLDAWPPRDTWSAQVSAHMLPAAGEVFSAAWVNTLTGDELAQLDDEQYVQAFLDDTGERLTGADWPDEVYDAVRAEVAEANAGRESMAELRARLARVLGLDSWSARVAMIARNESMAAWNGGTYRAGVVRGQVLGISQSKQWLAVGDSRTRPAHLAVSGSVVGAAEQFNVGGESMAYPHDPHGSLRQTALCRCVLNWLNDDDAATAQQLYEQNLPNVTDIYGRPVMGNDDTGDATGDLAASATDDGIRVNPDEGEREVLLAGASGSTTLPLADDNTTWSAATAKKAMASWADGDGTKLGTGFFWRDPDGDPTTLAAYKLPFADVFNGTTLKAVPAGVQAAAAAIQGSQGGVDIPDSDVTNVKARIAAYYKKMGKTPPWEDNAKSSTTTVTADATQTGEDAGGQAETDTEQQAPLYWAGPLMALDHRTVDSGPVSRMYGQQDPYRATNHPWLSYQKASAPGHDGKISIGRPEMLWIAPADADGREVPHLWGAGTFDSADSDAADVVRKIGAGYAGTVSADLANAQADLRWVDSNTNEQVDEPDEDQVYAYLEGEDIGVVPVEYVHTWWLAGATLVQDPGFHTGWIRATTQSPAEMVADNTPVWELDMSSVGPLAASAAPTPTAEPGSQRWCEQVAAAVPWTPPAAWFSDPQLSGPTKVTVADDGRVFGHVARWDTLHEVHQVPPPHCPFGGSYPKFHRHPVATSDGGMMLTGPLATNGHASTDASVTVAAAQMHYDDPNFILADVVAGEDQHGIWVAGALRPGVSAFQVLLAHRYSFSGDWRDGAMIAACSCSVPAFSIHHDETVVALAASAGPDRPRLDKGALRIRRHPDGTVAVLVASGIVRPEPDQRVHRCPVPPAPLSGTQLYREFKAAEAADRRVTALRRRVRSDPAALAATAARLTGRTS